MKSVLPILPLITAIKILLIPSYYSTDFHVHRNWLAITRHLPLSQWYFDDVDGGTVHTLDYPPGFAWFEYLLSNNAITNRLVEWGWLDGRCLELLPDDDNTPSDRCVVFQRCTVIISDAMLFLGAYLASTAYGDRLTSSAKEASELSFLLIVTNPGLIMLDHIHFQYNGMLLGLLLCSIACIIRGDAGSNTQRSKKSAISSQTWELCGAAFFALLLSMKHLYMTLAPLYLVYLLRHYCFIAQKEKSSVTLQFSFTKFVFLGVITLVCFLGPFVPFLLQDSSVQMEQILKRLFPFGRGVS
jgi:alpha-1,3-glucosyltransferase